MMNATTDKPFDVAKLQENIRQFGELLGEVIKEQEGEAVYATVEKLRRGYIRLRKSNDAATRDELMSLIDSLDVDMLEQVIRGFNTFYILTNINI